MKHDLQPIPKRFMVFQQFGSPPNNWHEVKTCYGHEICIGLDGRLRVSGAGRDTAAEEFLINNSKIIICQSTNLFDKDGKEIFEGSIVKWLDSKTGIGLGEGVVRVQNGMTFIERPSYDLYPDWDEEKENLVLVGHILSNPELLE